MEELQDVYRLQALVAVIEEGSLTAAVRKLHITQPALSARLKLLEESLNCVLLERTARGVRPTPVGKLVYEISVDILKRMRHLQLVIRNHQELKEGYVHIAGIQNAVNGLFPSIIEKFRNQFPSVQFCIYEKDSIATIQAVVDGMVELGFILSPELGGIPEGVMEQVVVLKEITEKIHVIAPLSHPLALMNQELKKINKKLLPMHINGQPIINFHPTAKMRDVIDWEMRKLAIRPKTHINLKSPHSMISMVEKGIGLSVASEFLLTERKYKVEILDIQGLEIKSSIYVIAKNRELTPAAKRFLEILDY